MKWKITGVQNGSERAEDLVLRRLRNAQIVHRILRKKTARFDIMNKHVDTDIGNNK